MRERVAQREVPLFESFGDRSDPLEFLRDDPSFGTYTSPISRIDDRADGQYRPYFSTEQELAIIRGVARTLTGSIITAKNVLQVLADFTVGSGFTHACSPASSDSPEGLDAEAQEVLDDFQDRCDWRSDLERELFLRAVEDGETFLVLRPNGWRTTAEIAEPDCVLQPADHGELSRWLEVDEQFVSSWSFGVHTRRDEPWNPLGYHVVRDTDGFDWEYLPTTDNVPLALDISSAVCEHFKRNVPRGVKRGLSDFLPCLHHLQKSDKLQLGIVASSNIQANIALIRSHEGVSNASISSFAAGRASGSYQYPVAGGGTQTIKKEHIPPGSIVDAGGNSRIYYGPMGQSSAPSFTDVLQSALRYIASRWAMPEFLVSSDASNNNYASILVSGSPFVKSRQADQSFLASRFQRVAWAVLRIAYEGGRFDRFGLSWPEFEAALDVTITPPNIVIADELKVAQVNEIEHRAGVLSARTWSTKSGHDPDVEAENIASEPRPAASLASPEADVDPTAPAASGIDVAGTALNGAQIASLVDILNQAANGLIPHSSVSPIITAAFPMLTPEQVQAIVQPLKGFEPALKPAPTAGQRLIESAGDPWPDYP